MKNQLTWIERYKLSISEELTVREIMHLRNISQPKALEIRKEVVKYCLLNNIEINCTKVPTEIVLEVTSLGVEYYYNKMLQEIEIDKLIKRDLCHVSS